jgi:dTDP-4-dehydrorhamnose 3,5-epimerase
MKFHETVMAGVYVIEQTPMRDDRGLFVRTFCAETFRSRGLADVFVQTNHTVTARRGTIRGLHYQRPPAGEAKLFRCVRGAVQDVVVDLRRGSPTFLRFHSVVLTDRNLRMVYAAPGCAHGFQALEDGVEVTYQVSAPYTPTLEGCLRYNDPLVNVAWMVPEVIVSEKDANCPLLTPDFRGVAL